MEKVCLIDGSGYIFRAFFASPMMTNPEGLPVNAVYGFLNMFLSLTQNIKCDYCLVLFDAKRQNFRNEIFKDYKATRPELPAELKPQFDLIHEVVEALNLHWLQMEGYEADDLIATYTDLALKEGKEVTIVSADKDLMQLIREGVTFYDSMKNKFFTPEDVKEKFGVYPERVTDVQALAGDSTDNIPGVPGIGIKTAAELVNQFGSLEDVLAHAEEIKQNKRRELIMTHKEDALISQKLVTLRPDVPVETKLEDLRCMAPHEDILLNLIDRHAFKSLKNKALNWLKAKCSDLPQEKIQFTPNYKLVQNKTDLTALATQIKAENIFSFAPITYKENLLGLSISLKNAKAFYIPLQEKNETIDLFSAPASTTGITKDELLKFLKDLFANPAILKVSLSLKENLHILEKALQTTLAAFPYDDVAIMSYDLYSSTLSHTLPALSTAILNQPLQITMDEYKKANLTTLPTATQLNLFAEISDFIMRLQQELRPQLLPEKKLHVYENIDLPMSEILLSMERIGIMLDTIKLKELDNRFDKEMNTLSEDIYTMADTTFNLSSPKQIGEILYNKLGLKGKKHTSGSLNTSAEVLEQMAETHELPKKILEWRQYQKLKSTYTSALLEQMDKEHRIHTTYSLTSVNTGRLSSYNPNLQNIPIRTPIGREIRECFIAKTGHKIIAADYSQVELRLLATIADVKFLQTAFGENVDIHRKTAAQVFGIPYDEVDSDHRRRAKAINFGIIYGMSAFGLAKEVGVTTSEAQQYINAYFENMPEVKRYMEETINFYHQNSYVLTPFNRKIAIPLPENKQLGAMYDKAAINAPIQGGAADIIKMAMIRVASLLKENNFKTKMLLQIHDELVFEAPLDETEVVAPLIKQAMENVTGINLKVPLIAEVGIGDNWGTAH